MRKLRSDSTFNRLPAAQREQLLNWVFDEGMSYAAAAQRVEREFGVMASAASVGRFCRYASEERRVGELAQAGGSVEDFRLAARKLLGRALLNACARNDDPREDGWKAVVALMKLMLKDEQQEMSAKRLELALQRVRLRK